MKDRRMTIMYHYDSMFRQNSLALHLELWVFLLEEPCFGDLPQPFISWVAFMIVISIMLKERLRLLRKSQHHLSSP